MITTRKEFLDFLDRADKAVLWCDIEAEDWEDACQFAGLCYEDFDDPDWLFEALTLAASGWKYVDSYEATVLPADADFVKKRIIHQFEKGKKKARVVQVIHQKAEYSDTIYTIENNLSALDKDTLEELAKALTRKKKDE